LPAKNPKTMTREKIIQHMEIRAAFFTRYCVSSAGHDINAYWQPLHSNGRWLSRVVAGFSLLFYGLNVCCNQRMTVEHVHARTNPHCN
jgi:hypothetical protein